MELTDARRARDNWEAGDAYESYMGRWSRPLARRFIRWLDPTRKGRWLELGCGTGPLTSAICELADPVSVLACDPSAAFVEHARKALPDDRVAFVVADAEGLTAAAGLDYVVAGLVLNFLPNPEAALARLAQRLRHGGRLAAYVWDYSGGMEFLRRFWDAAVELDPAAAALDEGRRFPLCRPDRLEALALQAGLSHVTVGALEIPTRFRGFEDFWAPLSKGTGPAPAYVASLSRERRDALRERLARDLGAGGLDLNARAWALSGVRA